MECKNCGTDLPRVARFCPVCGTATYWHADDADNTASSNADAVSDNTNKKARTKKKTHEENISFEETVTSEVSGGEKTTVDQVVDSSKQKKKNSAEQKAAAKTAKVEQKAAAKTAATDKKTAAKTAKADKKTAAKSTKAKKKAAAKSAKAEKNATAAESAKDSASKKPRKPLGKGAKIVIGVIVVSFIIAIGGSMSYSDTSKSSSQTPRSSSFSSAAEYVKVDDAIGEALKSDAFKNMSDSEQLDAATNLLKDAREKGLIKGDIIIDNDARTLSFTYANGTLGGIDLSYSRILEPPMNAVAYAATAQTWQEKMAQHVASENKPQLASGVSSTVPHILCLNSFEAQRDGIYKALNSRWQGMNLNSSVKMGSSIADFKSLKGYDIILFSMHGSRLAGHAVMCLDDYTSAGKDDTYSKDLQAGSLARVWRADDNCMHYYVFPSFIENSYSANALNGAFVFSEACKFAGSDSAGNDDEFGNAFLHVGAQAVSGMFNSVSADYSLYFNLWAIERMLEGKSVGEALSSAKAQYGNDDVEKGYKSADSPYGTAYPRFFGDANGKLNLPEKNSSSKESDSGSKSSSTTSASTSDKSKWKNAYYQFIDHGDYLDTAEFYTPSSPQDDYFPIEFGLYDMNRDGIPELLAYNGCENEASARTYLYTFENGSIRFLGKIGDGTIGSATQHYYAASNEVTGLFRASGRQEDMVTRYYEFANGKLTYMDVRSVNHLADVETKLTTNQKVYDASKNRKGVVGLYSISRIANMGMDSFAQKAGY